MKKDNEKKVSKRHKRLDTAVKQFNNLFNASLLHVEEQEIESNRLEEFHPSSLPFCGLRDIHRRLENGGLRTHKEMSMSSVFYTELGKVGHEIFQNWISKAAFRLGKSLPEQVKQVEVLGNWKCIKCRHQLQFTTYRLCPKCGSDMNYVEINYHKPPLKFSIDKVLKFGKYIIILDLKFTTSISIQSYLNRGAMLPYLSNREQITAYTSIFEKAFADKFKSGSLKGCKVIGWMLLYLARDNPTSTQNRAYVFRAMSDDQKVSERRKLRRNIRHFKLSRAKRINKAKIEKLIAEKPCKSKQDYEETMHEYFNPCDLGTCGDCFNPTKLKKILKAAYKSYKSKKVKGEKK